MTTCDIKRFALTLAVQAEIEGMKAINTMREANGHTVAYGEEAFLEKAEELRNIAAKHDDQL